MPYPLGADEHLAAGDALLLAAADAADHLVADLGVRAHLQAQHPDDVLRDHALVDCLRREGSVWFDRCVEQNGRLGNHDGETLAKILIRVPHLVHSRCPPSLLRFRELLMVR